MFLRKALICFLPTLLLHLILFVYPVKAAENFVTDYTVTYDIKSDGTAHAVMKVALTNAANDYYYASSYKIELGFEHLSNITASDGGGVITPQIEKTQNGYTIELVFNKKVVGIGNKQLFTLSFDTPDIAQKQGKIWEINIPGIEDAQSFNTFNVSLSVPKSFGKPSYTKPVQKNDALTFTKEQLSQSGISVAFGSEQHYAFTLLYHLQNKNLFPIRTEIAIPPNTNYQDILIDSMEPRPVQVKKDQDGNWLAEYTLSPAQSLDVKVKGRVKLYLFPREEKLTAAELQRYLKERPFWNISDKKVSELAQTLKTPEAIYAYVIKTLEYDFSRVTSSSNRLGAAGVLASPKNAVCLEFTDLFIALARAAGIPAREVDGYAYTENPRQRPLSLVTDILHAWPEYYDTDTQTWIMVDPTWGDTTGGVDYFHVLDFDHFAFVKKGESSTYPIPAGGYKVDGGEEKKDVFIWATEEDTKSMTGTLAVTPSVPHTFIAGLPIEGHVMALNSGPGVIYDEKISVYAPKLQPEEQTLNTGELLPFATKNLAFRFESLPFLTNKSYAITIRAGGRSHSDQISVTPVYVANWKLLGGFIGVLFASVILIFTLKTRRVRVSR